MTASAEGQVSHGWQGRTARMSPEAVRRYDFGRTTLGRRGYVEAEVERFRNRVADELARAEAEKAELREEIYRLRNYFRDRGIDGAPPGRHGGEKGLGEVAPGGAPSADLIDVQAVNLLSRAQQAADQHIAAAEDYARMLVRDARVQYEDILVRAQEEAEAAAGRAADDYKAVTALGERVQAHEELAAKLAYMRTFAEVTQVQMRSILDALRLELDRLADLNGSLPVAGPGPTGPPRRTGRTPTDGIQLGPPSPAGLLPGPALTGLPPGESFSPVPAGGRP